MSGPRVSISTGASPPARHHARSLPRWERAPVCRSTAPATSLKTVVARAFDVITYRSSRKLNMCSDGKRRCSAWTSASCWASAYRAGINGHPCSPLSPCTMSWVTF
eukprot:9418021-Pyramimonas_sp.AAC.1